MASIFHALNTGTWRTPASWLENSGYPVAGDTVIFGAGFTGKITLGEANACAILDLSNNAGTLAFGTSILTVSALATLKGNLTSTTGYLAVAGGVTLVGNCTGTFNMLSLYAGQTLTSNGYTWPFATRVVSPASGITLVGDWVNNGLFSFTSGTPFINKTTTEALILHGGLSVGANTGAGNAVLQLTGTWSGSGRLQHALNFAGNSIVSGTVSIQNSTITKSAGVTVQTTGSTLNIVINSSNTLNTPLTEMVWNNINITNTAATLTLTSPIICVGNFTTITGSTSYTTTNVRLSQSGSTITITPNNTGLFIQ